MIRTQKNYSDYLTKVEHLLEKIERDTSTQKRLREEIVTKELIVPVVGGFSAGKSTLINSFLGSDILSTNLTPETALATELRYDNNNHIKAIKADGSYDTYTLEQMEDIKNKASQYQYLKLYLENEKLKAIQPLVLVDMPGFDSPIELHNNAILNYLNKGVYFIVLTSIEDGNITKSILREIENITEFGKDFSFCLSKANLKGKDDVKAVQEKIQEQLEDYFDFKKEVIPLYENSAKELEKILKDINYEELFKKIFIDELKWNYLESESSINTIISTLKTSKDDVNTMLQELQDNIKIIAEKKEVMIEEAKAKYSNRSVESIINKVSRELMNNQDALVQMALHNQESFSRELNEIVKNTLIYEIRKKLNEAGDDIVDDLTLELKNLGSDLTSFQLNEQWIAKISESTKTLLHNAQNGLTNLVRSRQKNQPLDAGNGYKAITTVLGITTSVVNPLMEVVIVFLPEILSFINAKVQEQKLKQEIYNKFSMEIIPSIKAKLREELPILFENQINNIIEVISDQFENQLQQKKIEITKVQEEKEKNIKDIEQSLVLLEDTKQQVENLAYVTLFKG